MRGYGFGYVERLLYVWVTHGYIEVLEVKIRVSNRRHHLICFHNLLDLDVYKVVKRIDVLFHEAFHFEEGRQQFPFVSHGVNGFGEVFAIFEETFWE